jgi:hypothetical protein
MQLTVTVYIFVGEAGCDVQCYPRGIACGQHGTPGVGRGDRDWAAGAEAGGEAWERGGEGEGEGLW